MIGAVVFWPAGHYFSHKYVLLSYLSICFFGQDLLSGSNIVNFVTSLRYSGQGITIFTYHGMVKIRKNKQV